MAPTLTPLTTTIIFVNRYNQLWKTTGW
jgi:hypothetical protein